MNKLPRKNEYRPENVTPPGVTIAEVIAYRFPGVSIERFATEHALPYVTLTGILLRNEPIDESMADMLEKVLHIPHRFLLARERNYREALKDVNK